MKTTRPRSSSRPPVGGDLAGLQLRLAKSEDELRAIHAGEVDTVVVAGKKGDKVFSLAGAEHAYRVLIESMNEGALMLTTDKIILYANQRFADIVRLPLEKVTGSSFRSYLSPADSASLRPLMKRAAKSGSTLKVMLRAGDEALIPVQLSIREIVDTDSATMTIAMVVTDMTETRRTEELLRALTHRVVQVQEDERGRVALALHDHVTQRLCAVLLYSQALADKLSTADGSEKGESKRISALLAETVDEVERISRDLRPNLLDQLGLDAALRSACTRFANRTGLVVNLDCAQQVVRMPAGTDLAIYRIFQEALRNVAKHAGAHHVTVRLSQTAAGVELLVKDDGVGFDARQHASKRNKKGVLGLLAMEERATAAGGVLTIKSGPAVGTEIIMHVPLPSTATEA